MKIEMELKRERKKIDMLAMDLGDAIWNVNQLLRKYRASIKRIDKLERLKKSGFKNIKRWKE